MEHEELVKLVKELEMRVAALERRDSAGSRENCQEKSGIRFRLKEENVCGIQSRVKDERTLLPERAWELLERARDGGLLGEDWRPLISKRKCGILANIISYEVWRENKWRIFERLWGVKNLSSNFDHATFMNYYDDVVTQITTTLGVQKSLSVLTDY